ncbi:MAG: PAS domain-containing protein, partial [Gemmatimonadales bacterium]|nr:PAS domain-containing protein [Gemmatimonadales bacterium]
MCLAVAVYVSAALKVKVVDPLDILVTSLVLLTAAAVTLASYWHTHIRRRLPGQTFLYLQAVFDVALITAVVHVTGGPESDFAGLYVVVIAVVALLMRPANAGLVTLFAGLVYFADVFWGHTVVFPGTWIQLAVFVIVAVVIAYVASRVTVMGAEREALAAEVRQVQLEADDVLRNIRTGVITVDADGRLLYANPASEDLLGFRAREWIGRPVMPELARLAPEFWAAVTSTARHGVRLMRVEA